MSYKHMDLIIGACMCAVILLMGGMVVYAIFDTSTRVYPNPLFNDGQIVQMRLSGDRGMVVSHYCSHRNETCNYSIRFSSLQMNTNVSLFGSDGAIDVAPVALVRGIKEFELERENDERD